MKHNLSLRLYAIFLLGPAFLMASCGGGNKPAASGTASDSAASGSAIALSFWHTSSAGLSNAFKDAATAFAKLVKENEGVDVTIDVQYAGGYTDIENKIIKGFATGNIPTMAIAYPDHVADYLAKETADRTYVVNLEEYASDPSIGFGKEAWLGDEGIDDFVPAFYQEGTHYAKTGLYSLPFMKSSELLYYNSQLATSLAKDYTPAGYSAPLSTASELQKFLSNMTWDQFIDFARHIKANPPAIDGFKAPIVYDSDANLFISHSYQKDIPYLSIGGDGKCSVDFKNDAAKAMVTEFKKEYDEGLFVTEGTEGTYGSNTFKAQQCVFSVGSSGGSDYQMPDSATFTPRCVMVPYDTKRLYVTQGPSITILKSGGLSDAENALRSKYAFKFAKYLTGTKLNAQLCVNESAGYTPVRTSSYQTEVYQSYIADFEGTALGQAADIVANQLGDKYFNTPAVKGSSTARIQVGSLMTQVFAGKMTVDEAFDDAYTHTMAAI